MKHNLKALGLALIAAFAMSAVMTSVAQAQTTGPAAITIEGGSGVITGQQEAGTNIVLTRQGRTFTCAEETQDANVNSGDTTVTFAPAYGACESPSVGGPATVTMNSCHFTFHLEGHEVEGQPEDTWTATLDLHCTNPGDKVQIHLYSSHHNHTTNVNLCTYEYSEQTGLGTIDLTNKAASEKTPKNWITTDVNVTGLSSKRTAGSALICGSENDASGTMTGVGELKGENPEGEPRGITISTHTL